MSRHSLIAVQTIIRVREKFGIELPLQTFFETANIRRLAEAIFQNLITRAEDDGFSEALRDLSQLSEEDAKQLLASERP